MSITSIKVTTGLRERVQEHAKRSHVSQAAVLERALDLLDRDVFFETLRRDVAEHPEAADERREREDWLGGSLVSGDDG
ncbi:MAG: hypothetical protein ABIS84_02525 [Arachnia sp.]